MTLPPDALGAVLAAEMASWPGQAAAGVVARPSPTGGPELVAAYGPVDEVFEWASVTKLLVALASMVAVEEGTVGFEDPVGPPGSTVSHLLAHASGLPFEGNQPVAAPGRRRIYSNTGIELAAGHVGSAAGMPFAEYLSAGVLQPLGMAKTGLDGSPAHGAAGPLADLVALAGELLAPTLVSPETLRKATSVAWPGLAGVLPGFGRQDPCDWGLGPRSATTRRPIGPGGPILLRLSVTLARPARSYGSTPTAELAVAGLSSTAFGPWAKRAWPALSDAVLAALGHGPDVLAEPAGT